jgi:hypothetical protein
MVVILSFMTCSKQVRCHAAAGVDGGPSDGFVRHSDARVRSRLRSPGGSIGTALALEKDMNRLFTLDPDQRRRFWNRLCRMGLVRERELVRIHRLAQSRRIPPEGAVVAMGILSADQAAELLSTESPFGLSMESLGIS